ncbi:MAG: NAD(+)/NADH kinase [Oscillospiraceae bacterium]|jgi:NAD+ kinase|nr:NAD(+)/NADH kinase [Oscillospiraceae bacterium]
MHITLMINPTSAKAVSLAAEVRAQLDALELSHSDTLSAQTDIILTVGGDGTVLRAARHGLPVLGIHAGTVGFLTEIDRCDLPQLVGLVTGDYTLEERVTLTGQVPDAPEQIHAINDIYLTATEPHRAVTLTCAANGQDFAVYRGDGVIVATPTGSTAYSLAAGGSAVQPDLPALLLTPLYTHSLGATPLIFSADNVLSVRAAQDLRISADGHEALRLPAGQIFTLRRGDQNARFVRLNNAPFARRLNRLA